MRSRFPHGGEVLGAAPANPILAPVLSQDRGLGMSRQRDLLDLQAIQRIPGLVGYWKADPQYLFEDSAGTTPASTSGTGPVGCWRRVGDPPVYTPVPIANPGFDTDSAWTKGTGWSIGDNVATKSAGTASVLSQAVTLTAGTQYLVSLTMTRTAGSLLVRFTGGTIVAGTYLTASGQYEENLLAATGNTTLEFYAPADFAGTIDNVTLVSVSNAPGIEATTSLKPILRKTPTTGVYWLDSNTTTSALNVATGNLGASCTVARATPEGVTFTENVSITSTYNIAPAFSFNSDVAIFNRSLTATEKALITRYMQRAVPMLGSNLFLNSNFDAASSWSLANFSIADGVATKSATGATGFIRQSVGVAGKQYLSKFSLVVWSAGSIGHFNGANQFGTYVSPANYVGVYVGGGSFVGVSTNTAFLGSVDDVYLQEIL